MVLFIVMFISTNAFYDAHFSSLPARATSFFSNPAGLGLQPGSEILFMYDKDYLLGAALLGYGGMGVMKANNTYRYEAGIGYRLPGAFSFGYAYQFGDTSSHVVGVIGALSPRFSMGYKTTWGERKHMFYGISLRPFERYLTLVGDTEYEGISGVRNYYYGAVLQPHGGFGLSFSADQDFNWRAGLMISFGRLKAAGLYIDETGQFSVGVVVSAQSYESIISEAEEETYLDF